MTTKLTLNNLTPETLAAISGPRISNVQIADSQYNTLDDTAANVGGGYIIINGQSFNSAAQVLIDQTPATTITWVSNTQIRAEIPASTEGTSKSVYVINPDGSLALLVNGLTYSAFPAWSTGSTLTSSEALVPISIQLSAPSATVYTLAAANTLPSSLSLYANGLIAGTVAANTTTNYNFTVNAKDAENQDTSRNFTLPITRNVEPAWTTAADLGSAPVNQNYLNTLVATDLSSIIYSVAVGSSLPANLTLAANGLLSGSVSTANTYSFAIVATDTANLSNTRTFSISIIAPDPYSSYNTLLLNGEGAASTNGSNNSVFIDSSTNNFNINRFGNTNQGTRSPYGYNWSNYFDGTGDYLTVPTTSTQNQWWTENFTIEAWVYPTNLSTWLTNTNPCLIGNMEAGSSTNYWSFGPNTNGTVRFKYFNGGSVAVDSTETISLNQWSHIAFVKDSNGIRIYVNGVGTTSTAVSGTPQSTSGLTIGQHFNSSILGYVSNIRVVKGTAVYTSAFTPSTTPLTAISGTSLLTCQSNRFIDNSPNSFALTRAGDTSVQAFGPFGSIPEAVPISYSNYFDGTGDYLTVANNIALQLGSTYTVEVWCYLNSYSSNDRIISDGSTNAADLDLGVGSDGRVFYAGAIVYVGESYILPLSTWTHIAVVVNAGTLSIYINGVSKTLIGTTTGYNHTNSGTKYIGAYQGSSLFWRGYISNLRLVKGTAVYTSTFTPSTTPLTAIANTSLLTCQSTRMIDNSTNNFTITASGDTKPRIFNPFGYTAQSATSYTPTTHGGSAYFDGTGDYLTIPNSAFDLTPTTWSIEYWIYPTTIAGGYYGLWALSTSGFRQAIYTDSGTHYLAVLNGGGGYGGFSLVASNKVITLNNWQHVALTSDGTTIRQFYNGVQTSTGSAASFSASTPTIGSWGGANYFTGYMSDFRITKGSAVYTSNFVPPTSPLTAIANTSLLTNFTNAGIIDQTGQNNLETVGNAQLSTAVKKYGSASIYFDGTGDSLKIIDNPNINLGSGDFTLECWVYFNVVNTEQVIFSKGWQSSSAYASYLIYMTSAASLRFGASSSGGSWDIANEKVIGTMTAGVWTHIAVTRSGTSFRAFIDGVINNSFTFTSSSSLANIPAQTLFIGGRTDSNSTMNGYIDDLRITKGYARYTTTFTPPTAIT